MEIAVNMKYETRIPQCEVGNLGPVLMCFSHNFCLRRKASACTRLHQETSDRYVEQSHNISKEHRTCSSIEFLKASGLRNLRSLLEEAPTPLVSKGQLQFYEMKQSIFCYFV